MNYFFIKTFLFMMYKDNGRSIKDAIGQIIHEGDRVVN